ncbi:MAG: hypothetical protein WBP81_14635, partial [Solirubrobacteraceae bacterium]
MASLPALLSRRGGTAGSIACFSLRAGGVRVLAGGATSRTPSKETGRAGRADRVARLHEWS